MVSLGMESGLASAQEDMDLACIAEHSYNVTYT